VDRAARSVARLGLRHLRRAAVQLRRTQLRTDAAAHSTRNTRGARRVALLDGSPHGADARRMGRGRHRVRPRHGSARTNAHPAPHDGALLARHGRVRIRPESLVPGAVPDRREPRDRREGRLVPRWWGGQPRSAASRRARPPHVRLLGLSCDAPRDTDPWCSSAPEIGVAVPLLCGPPRRRRGGSVYHREPKRRQHVAVATASANRALAPGPAPIRCPVSRRR
jgi:hypothetical protein